MLPDEAVTLETELLESRQSTVEQEAGGHGVGRFGITLDATAPGGGDHLQRTGEGGLRDPLATVTAAHVEAGDPPVGEVALTGLLVVPLVLDPGKFIRRPELAPADAEVVFEHEGVVGGPLEDPESLALLVDRSSGLAHAFGMKSHAPAPARIAVAALGQLLECRPGRLVERLDGPHVVSLRRGRLALQGTRGACQERSEYSVPDERRMRVIAAQQERADDDDERYRRDQPRPERALTT